MMINFIEMKIEITTDKKYFEAGANIMCHSEPWITLKRNYYQCLQAFDGDYKEIKFDLNVRPILPDKLTTIDDWRYNNYIQNDLPIPVT